GGNRSERRGRRETSPPSAARFRLGRNLALPIVVLSHDQAIATAGSGLAGGGAGFAFFVGLFGAWPMARLVQLPVRPDLDRRVTASGAEIDHQDQVPDKHERRDAGR